MSLALQFTLDLEGVDEPHAQRFEAWKTTAGGNWILEQVYRRCSKYARIWKATGQQVSVRLIWEEVRYWDLKKLRRSHPGEIRKTDGYAMNDHFHSLAVRHICKRRPDWAGMFETRELGKPRKPTEEKTITVRRFK